MGCPLPLSEKLDNWLHAHGLSVELVCSMVDWSNGMPFRSLLREWRQDPWRVVAPRRALR